MLILNNTNLQIGNLLRSDYGFELSYIPGRGQAERTWRQILRNNHFNAPWKWKWSSYATCETRQEALWIRPFTVRPCVLTFVWLREWYSVGYDGQRIIVQTNDGNESLEETIL